MEEALQHDQATQLFGLSSTGTRGAVSSQLANVNKLTNLTLAPLQGAGHTENETTTDTMRLDLWTDKGRDDLIYHKGERLKLYARVDRPCYLRLIYHFADGRRALLVDNRRIDSSKVNGNYIYSEDFVCDAPFGVEVLQVLSRTERFEPVSTVESQDGYKILPSTLDKLLGQLRGIRPAKGHILQAERRITITTLEN